jgi:hypothetical protein
LRFEKIARYDVHAGQFFWGNGFFDHTFRNRKGGWLLLGARRWNGWTQFSASLMGVVLRCLDFFFYSLRKISIGC